MLRVMRSLTFVAALAGMLAYLGLSAAMAGGDMRVVDGQIVRVADLCGGDGAADTQCPFCALAQAVALPQPVLHAQPLSVRPIHHAPAAQSRPTPAPSRLRPPVRAPPEGLV